MQWNPDWDLTTIPTKQWNSEAARRRQQKREYRPSCGHKTPKPKTCAKCRQRLYRRERRKEGLDRT